MYNFQRSDTVPEISKLEEKFESFLSNYFGASYDEEVSEKWEAVTYEIETYFKDGKIGGWSSYYCKATWNDETLENEADFEIFDLLFKIDIKNGADTSKIVDSLCLDGAFEAVKVRFRQIYRVLKKILLQILLLIFIYTIRIYYHQICFKFKIVGQVCFKS